MLCSSTELIDSGKLPKQPLTFSVLICLLYCLVIRAVPSLISEEGDECGREGGFFWRLLSVRERLVQLLAYGGVLVEKGSFPKFDSEHLLTYIINSKR